MSEKETTNKKYHYGLGRRKEAHGRVRLFLISGESQINGKTPEDYFNKNNLLINKVNKPLVLVGLIGKSHYQVKIEGGGLSGQAEAIALGIARAITKQDESYRSTLKKAGLLTRDQREKERKKYGLKRARKAPQFSKR